MPWKLQKNVTEKQPFKSRLDPPSEGEASELEHVNFQPTKMQNYRLNVEARERGISKGALLREILTKHIASEDRRTQGKRSWER